LTEKFNETNQVHGPGAKLPGPLRGAQRGRIERASTNIGTDDYGPEDKNNKKKKKKRYPYPDKKKAKQGRGPAVLARPGCTAPKTLSQGVISEAGGANLF